MKIVSWNVNGLRACMKKGFENFFQQADADIFCIQETKLQPEQVEKQMEGYYSFFNSAVRKGYSGTAVYTRIAPCAVSYNFAKCVPLMDILKLFGNDTKLFYDKKELPGDDWNQEGRVITLEFKTFYIVTVYTPNTKRDLERLPYRIEWEDKFRDYVINLNLKKSVIICGDLNAAHQEMDLKKPKQNVGNAGFTMEERQKLSQLLENGFLDSFRLLYPEKTGAYTWWSYLYHARERNIGWRIDYFLISEDLKNKIKENKIYSEIYGSDHCPIGLEVEE